MAPAQPEPDSAAHAELILGVADALLELPAVGVGLAALDPLELRARLLEVAGRPLRVDLAGSDRVVDEREGAVGLDLEEAGAGRELEHLAARVHARRACL